MSEHISQLQQIGVNLALTYGSPSLSFTRGLLASKFTANPGKQAVGRVPEVRGTKATIRVTKGPLDYDVQIEMPLDASGASAAGIGDFLATLMGTDTANLAGGISTHAFHFLESAVLPFINLHSTKDNVHRQLLSFRANEMKFTIKSGDPQIMVSINGFAKDEADLAATQTLVYSTAPLIIPSHMTAFTVNNATPDNFEQVEITLKSDAERFRAISASRAITQSYSKLVSVEIKLTGLNFASETIRTAYKDVTALSTNAFLLTLAQSTTNSISFSFPQCNITAFEGPNISDADLMKINMTLLATGTLANEVITVANDYAFNYATGVAL